MESRNFLTLTLDQQLEYLEHSPEPPTKKATEIACIGTLKLNSLEKYSVSCLIVGTEDGNVIVLDPQTFTELFQVLLFANLLLTKRSYPFSVSLKMKFNLYL